MPYSHVDCNSVPLEKKLDSLFQQKNDGFFIELGANDGLTQSNTVFLERERGWTGILIEPSVRGYKLCKKNRPNSICLNYACVSSEYTEKHILGDFSQNNLMGSVDGNRLKKTQNLVSVKVKTLESILDHYIVNGKMIDLLSLDTEGYELNILKGLNLNRYRPRYLLIEIYVSEYDKVIKYLNLLTFKTPTYI